MDIDKTIPCPTPNCTGRLPEEFTIIECDICHEDFSMLNCPNPKCEGNIVVRAFGDNGICAKCGEKWNVLLETNCGYQFYDD
ncbi:MAG: hypothetical protein MUO85_02275 [candidate division Zixibacteria bacterium]|nr:hypothetical protein [candidate division Zixibacteria bacterium]